MKSPQPSSKRKWHRNRKIARLLKKKKTYLPSVLKQPWYWWLSGAAFILLLTWVAYPVETQWDPIRVSDFEVGKSSPYTVVSPISTEYTDLKATELLRANTKAEVPPVFRVDLSKLDDLGEMFADIRGIRSGEPAYEDEKVKRLRGELLIGHSLSEEALRSLASMPDEMLTEVESNIERLLGQILRQGVVRDHTEFVGSLNAEIHGLQPGDDGVAPVNQETQIELHPSGKHRVIENLRTWAGAVAWVQQQAMQIGDPVVRSLVNEIGRNLIRPNLVYDNQLTEARRSQISQTIAPIQQGIHKGEVVVGRGQEVTADHVQALKAIHSELLMVGARKMATIRTAVGVGLLVALLVLLTFIYLRRYEAQVINDYRKLLAFFLSITLITLLSKVALLIGHAANIRSIVSFDLMLLMPTAIVSAILTILFNPATAIMGTLIVGTIIALMGGTQASLVLPHLFVTLAGGAVAILVLWQVRRRRDLAVAGLYVGIANVICIAALSLLTETAPSLALQNVGAGLVSGVLVALLTPGLLPLFEGLSRITTNIRLLELSDLNHPLLKQLEEKAMGTYHHSMNVSKLAEAAAEAIGANDLLARVGAYYHDIGKMKHSRYFTENQEGGPNPHDKLGPSRSAKIIATHVTAGIEMAREYKLPKVIEEMIPQHHGTSLISFFHLKALQTDKHTEIREDDFRYVGPRPQTKEAAIMMLADSVEAASRSLYNRLSHPTPKDIGDLIQQIINKKVSEGQLDESNLSLKELQVIAATFERVLCGFYHSRIDYPKDARNKETSVLKAVMTNGGNKQHSEHSRG